MALTAEQKAFVDWQLAQVDPLTGRRIGDIVAEKGLDPYRDEVAGMADNANLQAQNQLAAGGNPDVVAPWKDPNWAQKQAAAEEAEYQRRAQLDADWRAAQAAGVDVPVLGPSNDPNLGNVTRGPAPYGSGAKQPATTGTNQPPAPGANPLVPSNNTGNLTTGGGTSGGLIDSNSVVGGGLGTSGPVYGPDGQMYSSAASALAAGVTNYSFSKPVFSSGPGGVNNAGNPFAPAPNSATGNANSGGLIAGANQQLFQMQTGAQMPPPVQNPFRI